MRCGWDVLAARPRRRALVRARYLRHRARWRQATRKERRATLIEIRHSRDSSEYQHLFRARPNCRGKSADLHRLGRVDRVILQSRTETDSHFIKAVAHT